MPRGEEEPPGSDNNVVNNVVVADDARARGQGGQAPSISGRPLFQSISLANQIQLSNHMHTDRLKRHGGAHNRRRPHSHPTRPSRHMAPSRAAAAAAARGAYFNQHHYATVMASLLLLSTVAQRTVAFMLHGGSAGHRQLAPQLRQRVGVRGLRGMCMFVVLGGRWVIYTCLPTSTRTHNSRRGRRGRRRRGGAEARCFSGHAGRGGAHAGAAPGGVAGGVVRGIRFDS